MNLSLLTIEASPDRFANTRTLGLAYLSAAAEKVGVTRGGITGAAGKPWIAGRENPRLGEKARARRVGIVAKKSELDDLINKKAFISDMDGVLYHGNKLLPGVLQFVEWLKAEKEFLFLTNDATRTPRELSEKLLRLGIDVDQDHFFTSPMATARYLATQKPKGSCFVIGEPGLISALYDAGFSMNDSDPDYVVLGRTTHYRYQIIEKAIQLVYKGAHLIITNPDAYYPTEAGFAPSTGALVAPIEIATGKKAYYVGKPNPLMMRLALEKIGCQPGDGVMIGDRMDTDILVGIEAQLTTVLVLSGAMTREDIKRYGFKPSYVLRGVIDIAEAVNAGKGIQERPQAGKPLSIFQKVMFLKTTDYFSSTPEELLAKIAPVLEEVEVESGKKILEQGKPNSSLYVVLNGAVRVQRGKQEIASFGKGETFGEMGVLDPDSVASANVVASQATRLIRLDREAFFQLLEQNADIAQNMLKVLSQRLRDTTDKLEKRSKK